jgi:vacuolar-type H+-ATPase subunit F/Vma7
MQGKAAVLGDADFVMPFAALGLDTYTTGASSGDVNEAAKKIVEENYALVIVAENIAASVEEEFSSRMNLPTPCIVVVPFTTESEGFATSRLGKVLKMATGISIAQNS